MNEPEFEAWNVSEHKFPREENNVDKLRFLLKYAILAPSDHNTQPWLFKIAQFQNIVLHICLHFPTKRILLHIITNLEEDLNIPKERNKIEEITGYSARSIINQERKVEVTCKV